jgi:hypothetical protein
MEALPGLASTVRLAGDCNSTRATESGAKARVRWGRVCRMGKEAGAGGVEVANLGTGQVKAKELNSPLSRGAGVVGGAIPMTGAGVAEDIYGSR